MHALFRLACSHFVYKISPIELMLTFSAQHTTSCFLNINMIAYNLSTVITRWVWTVSFYSHRHSGGDSGEEANHLLGRHGLTVSQYDVSARGNVRTRYRNITTCTNHYNKVECLLKYAFMTVCIISRNNDKAVICHC